MGPAKELGRQVRLELVVLAALLFLCCVKAELHIEKTPSPVKAILGKNLTIPCVLTREGYRLRDLDLVIVGIRWKKISLNGSETDVYKFLNLGHIPIRPESFIDERELKRGDASLTLQHVQGSDEGEYTCTAFVTPDRASAKINVQALAQPNVTLSATELILEPGSEKSVTCEVSGFYPETVKIRWVRYSKSSHTRSSLDKATYFTVAQENADGSFSVTSLLTVSPASLEEDGDSYYCNVQHASFSRDMDVGFTLTVKKSITVPVVVAGFCVLLLLIILILVFLYFKPAPPMVSEITGLDDLAHGNITFPSCKVSGFRPQNIEIQFCLKRFGDSDEKPIATWKHPMPSAQHNDTVDRSNGQEESLPLKDFISGPSTLKEIELTRLKRSYFSYSCDCLTPFIPDKEKDQGADLIIKVIHRALKCPLIITTNLNIKGDIFRLSAIKAPTYFKLGEVVTLTCEISKCNPGRLHVTWLKEDLSGMEPTLIIHEKEKTYGVKYTHEEKPEEQHNLERRTSSSLTFNVQFPEDHNAKYICRVHYPAISQILEASRDALVTVTPVLEPIRPTHEVHYVGQQMELSCRIHSFSPQTLGIQWYKGDEILKSPEHEIQTGADGLHSTTSILHYTPKTEDKGKVFKCKVDHQGFEQLQELEWQLKDLRTNDIGQ